MSQEIVCKIRCPIHGFIELNAWEKSIVDTPVFQRLRRIRQLGWTDYVYPGAMHTRFEHSLGVMHVATLLFDSIVTNSKKALIDGYDYDDHGLAKERQKIRLAALLHDVGHSPFSHASETAFPPITSKPGNHELPFHGTDLKRYKHEDYSYAIIKTLLRESIEEHSSNKNYGLKAEDLVNLLSNDPGAGHSLFWTDLLANQLDADRMDYLLRDSYHLGVNYGKFDLHRLVSNVCAYHTNGQGMDPGRIRIGVYSGGLHAAESLLIARYSMFKQVYFHKTRMAFDIHLEHVMKELLSGGCFPPPDQVGLDEYLTWDDWKVLGLLATGAGGAHARRLLDRNHYRQVYRTKDRYSSLDDALGVEPKRVEYIRSLLSQKGIETETKTSTNVWYKLKRGSFITVVEDNDPQDQRPLSECSPIALFNSGIQHLLYVRREDVDIAKEIVNRARNDFDQLHAAEGSSTVSRETIVGDLAKKSEENKKPPTSADLAPAEDKSIISKGKPPGY